MIVSTAIQYNITSHAISEDWLIVSSFCRKVSKYHNQHGILVNESGYFWHPLLQVVYIYICLQAECLFQMEKVMEHVRANSLSGQTELPLLVDRLLSKLCLIGHIFSLRCFNNKSTSRVTAIMMCYQIYTNSKEAFYKNLMFLKSFWHYTWLRSSNQNILHYDISNLLIFQRGQC